MDLSNEITGVIDDVIDPLETRYQDLCDRREGGEDLDGDELAFLEDAESASAGADEEQARRLFWINHHLDTILPTVASRLSEVTWGDDDSGHLEVSLNGNRFHVAAVTLPAPGPEGNHYQRQGRLDEGPIVYQSGTGDLWVAPGTFITVKDADDLARLEEVVEDLIGDGIEQAERLFDGRLEEAYDFAITFASEWLEEIDDPADLPTLDKFVSDVIDYWTAAFERIHSHEAELVDDLLRERDDLVNLYNNRRELLAAKACS